MSQGVNNTTDGAKEKKEKTKGKGGHLLSLTSLSASLNSNKGKAGKNSPDKVLNNNNNVISNNSSSSSNANSIFHQSSHQHSYLELIQMLIEVFHADPNLRNGGTQRTALHAAAQVGNLELVRYLCENCHVSYELDLFHDSPFDLAVRSGKTACAAYLKEYMDKQTNNNINKNINNNSNVANPVPVMSSYTINLGNKAKKEMQHTTNLNNNNISLLLETPLQPNFSSSAGGDAKNNSSNRSNDYNNSSETQRQEGKVNKVQSFAESSRSVMEQMKQELRLAADSCKLNEDSSASSSYGSRNSKATPRPSEPPELFETEIWEEAQNKTKNEDKKMQKVNTNSVLTDQININKDDETNEPFINNYNNNYNNCNNNNKTDMYVKRDTPLANLFSSNSDNSIEEHLHNNNNHHHQYEETDFVRNNKDNRNESVIYNEQNYMELLQQSCQVKLRKEVDISHYKFFQNVDLQSFRAHFGDGFTIIECIDHYEIRGLLPYTFKEVVYFTPVIIGVYSPVAPFHSSSTNRNNKKNEKVRSDTKEENEEFAYCRYRVMLDLENMASFAINRRATYIDPLSGSFIMSAVDRFYSTLDNNNSNNKLTSGTKENSATTITTGNSVKENKLVRFINETVIRNFEEVAPMIAQTSINAFPNEIPINKIGTVDGKNENWNHREKNLPLGFRNVLSQPKMVSEGTASQQRTSNTSPSSTSSSSMVYVPRSVEMLRHYRIIQDLSRFGDGLFHFSLASPLVMDGCIPIYNKTLLKCYCSRFSPNTPVQCPEHFSGEQQQQNLKMNEIPNGQVSGVLSSSRSIHNKTKQSSLSSSEQQEEFQESTILDVKDVSCVLMLKVKIKFYNSVTGSSGYESVPSVYLMELSDQNNTNHINKTINSNISPKENYLRM